NTTKALIECEDDNDKYLSLLSGIFIQFFKFYTVKTYDDKGKPILENADFYQKMIDIYNAEGPMIDGHKSNNATEFDVKYQNLFKNGTMTFLKMVYIAYGEKGFDEFIDHVKDDLKGKVKLNKDHLTMIKNNKSDDLFFR
ncbi:replication initiation protein, partial [Staphylococcus hominis]